MDHFISVEQAAQMTTTFRENKETILAEPYQNQNLLCIAETFDRVAFDKLLAQQGCENLRIYYGMDAELKVHAIIVGVNAEGQDILPAAQALSATADQTSQTTSDETTSSTEDDGLVVEAGVRCPPDCGTPSPLNP